MYKELGLLSIEESGLATVSAEILNTKVGGEEYFRPTVGEVLAVCLVEFSRGVPKNVVDFVCKKGDPIFTRLLRFGLEAWNENVGNETLMAAVKGMYISQISGLLIDKDMADLGEEGSGLKRLGLMVACTSLINEFYLTS